MIATILPKSSTFHAIAYNEKKVSEGVAVLLEKTNVSGLAALPGYTTKDLQQFFADYSSRNSRIRFPQFHVAISCKGNEYTQEQLVEFAHRYLAEMGYGETGQPLLIYGHNDTDNTHIHIITSRVAPDGHKIDHAHERRRSLAVVDRLMKNDIKGKVDSDISKAWEYTFRNIGEFQVIMQSLGYECYAKKDTGKVFIKYGGCICKSLTISEVEAHAWKNNHSVKDEAHAATLKKRSAQIYCFFNKHKHSCGSREEFADRMHRMFGLQIVFFGSKDNPSGYKVVDHFTKAVFHAPLALEKLKFRTYDERVAASKETINKTLAATPNATTRDVNKEIYREHGTYIKDGTLHIDKKKESLDESVIARLQANNKAAWKTAHPSAPHASRQSAVTNTNGSLSTATSQKSSEPAASSSVNRDWEVGNDYNKDDLDEQMKRQMKL